MTQALIGKHALVTGASGGIGRAIALRLASAGACVGVHYGNNREGARATVQAIEELGGRAFAVGADLRDSSQVRALLAQLDEHGCEHLDILVNNAGIGLMGNIAQTSEQDFARVFDTNVKGAFFLTQALLARLRDGGSITTISSVVSLAAYPVCIAYAMSKAAINSMTLSLAAELGPRRIRVNAVAPGATATAFLGDLALHPDALQALENATAFQRLGQADEIATVAEFLASPAGAWITGQTIQASGGMHL
ncbi:SDR family NAD(P)-dependent oxidoreductase [Pseudomonas umsongensis]|uniref:SDR family NAD(P)-dependent oxidoreductase n=1 Tax=Pseudomonas umsongensis TaxID=198618 RepID=UPI00200B6F71|nr:SDR family oxidoreductase [Pseudomonas umsongensis]MCK8683280.1 SDR family oxidoreductase [Pseudomonas umsongensis]